MTAPFFFDMLIIQNFFVHILAFSGQILRGERPDFEHFYLINKNPTNGPKNIAT